MRRRAALRRAAPPWGLLAVLVVLGEQVVAGGPVDRLDRAVEDWLVPRRDDIAGAARLVTDLGRPDVAVPLLLVLVACVALRRRAPAVLLRPVAAVVALTVSVLVLKDVVGRPSPHGGTSHGGAWPSGHAASATVVWGCAARLLGRPLLLVVPALVGVCLVLAGYHLVSDVLAGWALGALLLVLAARLPVPERERERERMPA